MLVVVTARSLLCTADGRYRSSAKGRKPRIGVLKDGTRTSLWSFEVARVRGGVFGAPVGGGDGPLSSLHSRWSPQVLLGERTGTAGRRAHLALQPTHDERCPSTTNPTPPLLCDCTTSRPKATECAGKRTFL